jgi:hypothetical protein
MCSRASRFALLSTLLTPWPLAAQTVDVLRHRADSLRREWQDASALADLQDSLHLIGGTAGRDTIRVGWLTILVNRSPLQIAQAARQAGPVIERLYGQAPRDLVDRPIVIEAIDPDTSAHPPPLGSAAQIKWDLDVPTLTRWLLNYVSAVATDRPLRQWLGGPLLFDTLAARTAAQQAYIQLVTTPSHAVRRCFLGELGACRAALSIADTADLLTQWYDRQERRTLVAKAYRHAYWDRGSGPELGACAAGNDSTCLALLRALPPGHLQPPLDYSARQALVAVALAQGGAGAIGRLLEGPNESVSARLTAAARISPDSLTRRWLERVRAARPLPILVPPWGAWIALGWIGIFATCGLRSSRWRVS